MGRAVVCERIGAAWAPFANGALRTVALLGGRSSSACGPRIARTEVGRAVGIKNVPVRVGSESERATLCARRVASKGTLFCAAQMVRGHTVFRVVWVKDVVAAGRGWR